ncbi:MAG: proline dehydrogenase family protein [Planctomycetota bacterium]
MSLFDGAVRVSLPLIPKRMLWTVARRYVAGNELRDALQAITALRQEGFGTIIDVLGENIRSAAQAEAAAAEYHRALGSLRSIDPACVLSVKPTHLGLLLDPALCSRLLADLCTAASEQSRKVRFEMEDAPTIDATLAVFRALRPRHRNLGCVLQARLFRTAADVEALLAEGPGLDVRLVKGIYLEPAAIAWTEGADISASYLRLAQRLLAGGAFVGLATHDGELVQQLAPWLKAQGHTRYELQCLMGVRPEQAQSWKQAGHPVRIYVPYGRDWHAYSLRRLRRNPQIARHVLAAMLRGQG